jgi:death-on-curing protein
MPFTYDRYIYFDISHALEVHQYIIDVTGGLAGIQNQGLLESVLANIQNDEYYPSFTKKLTHLVHSVIKLHSFNDGNKRSSIALGIYFLLLNDPDYCSLEFERSMENIVVWVAEGKIDKVLLEDLIDSILYQRDYSEELKWRLYKAISIDS